MKKKHSINICLMLLLATFTFINLTVKVKAEVKINTKFTCTYTTSDTLKYIGYIPGNSVKPSDVSNDFPFKFGGYDESIELKFEYDEKSKNYKVSFTSSPVYENYSGFDFKTDVMIGYYDGKNAFDSSKSSITVPASFLGDIGICPKRISLATYCWRGESTDSNGCAHNRPYIMLRNDPNDGLYTNKYTDLNPNRFYHSTFNKGSAGGYNFEKFLYGESIDSEDQYIVRTYVDNPIIDVKESMGTGNNITIDECCDIAKKSQAVGSSNPYDQTCKQKFGADYKKDKCGIQYNTSTGKVESNSNTGKIYSKQCEYTGYNNTTGAYGQVYFYEAYNWVYSSYEGDPVSDASQSMYNEQQGSKKFVESLNTSVGKWVPVRQASFAKNIQIFDNMSEQIKKYVDNNYQCNAKDGCNAKTYQEKFVEMANNSKGQTAYEYLHSLIIRGDLKDIGMNAFVDLASSENACISYNNKPWAPDEFYGCQVSELKLENNDVFSIFDSEAYDGRFYLFSNKADMEMMCPSNTTTSGDLHYYRYTFNNKKDPYVYRLTQDVELSCGFTQDFFKNQGTAGQVVKGITQYLGFYSGADSAKFSFIFTKDGNVKHHPVKGVSDLDIKFLFNKDQILDLYNVKSSTDVLSIDSLSNFLMFTTDIGTAKGWKLQEGLAELGLSVSVAIVGAVLATTLKVPKVALWAIKAGAKVISTALFVIGSFSLIDYFTAFFTKREDRTVILTNYLNLTNEEITNLKKELTKDGVNAFNAFRLSDSKNSFKCTIAPFNGSESNIGDEETTCSIFDKSTQLGKILSTIFNIIRIAAICILIVFGVLDFAKALIASDDDALKKAATTFIKRLIIVVLILFIPAIIDLLFKLINKDSCANSI